MKQKITIIIFLCSFLYSFAQISPKIKDLENKRKTTLQEIETTNKLLDETKKTTTNVLNRLNLLTQQIISRKKMIDLLNEETAALDDEISMMELNIRSLEKELGFKKESYAKSLQKMQLRKKTQDKLLFILSAKNFTQSYRRMRYLKEYATWQEVQAKEIIEKQKDINLKKEKLQEHKKEKLALLSQRTKENQTLRVEEQTKQAEVKDLKKQQKDLQIQLSKQKKQAAELNRQIEKAITEEIARAEKEARLAAENQANKEKSTGKKTESKDIRVAETKGGYAMTREERTLSANFANNRGVLPFPLKGSYKIVGRFGEQKHQELKYVITNNNGIDIQTSPGTEARAIFDGEVTKIFVVAGYNNSVIVRHGNYLTVYSNLQNVYVKSGDKVKTGQTIGKIFTDTEDGNITILHFELWKEKTKLNPEIWLD